MEKHCVYVKLCGGLGNQLFQIANGYAYSLRYNKNFFVSKTWDGMKPERPSYWNSILKPIQPYIKDISEFRGTHYKEPQWNYQKIPNIEGDIILEGYFQSEKYFSDYSEEVRKLFGIYPIHSELKNKVAIHIRRGDYLLVPNYHTILQKDYYDKGKEILEKKLETQNLQYVYFSEDTEWVKETFKNSMKESDNILSRLSDIEEFQLMINCNHFILANSSFSWWASWFSDIDNEAVIIAPSKWFGKDCHKNWSAIYKDKFIQI